MFTFKSYTKALNAWSYENGDKVRKEREQLKEEYRTQDGLANKLGITRQTLSKIETGKSGPSMQMLFNLCEVFDCDPGYLLLEHEDRTFKTGNIAEETGLKPDSIDELRTIKRSLDGRGITFAYDPKWLDFVSFFITEGKELGGLIDKAKTLKEIRALFDDDPYKDDVIAAYDESLEKNTTSNLKYVAAGDENLKFMLMESMRTILLDRLKSKHKLKETTAVNLADNKTKLYFNMMSELDNRINDFNISDLFLQIVRKYISG